MPTTPNTVAENPMPFNPETMTLNQIKNAADILRMLFDLALREGVTDEELGLNVRYNMAMLGHRNGTYKAKV